MAPIPTPFNKRIAELEKLVGADQARILILQNRYQTNRKRAFVAHNKVVHAEHAADQWRTRHGSRAERMLAHFEKVQLTEQHVMTKNHLRAQHFLGSIKTWQQQEHGLETRLDKLEAAAQHYLDTHGLHIVGNRVEGSASPFEKWLAATQTSVANCAGNHSRNFYSQLGSGFDIQHCIVGGPHYGERYDCSVYVTGISWSCGFDDPNGEDYHAGYTETMTRAHGRWHETSLHGMISGRKPGFVVYGHPGSTHHTEAWCPEMRGNEMVNAYRTAGHGSPPVDYGTIFVFGENEYQRYYVYG